MKPTKKALLPIITAVIFSGCLSDAAHPSSGVEEAWYTTADASGYTVPASVECRERTYATMLEDSFSTEGRVPATGFQLDDGGRFVETGEERWIEGSSEGLRKYTPFYRTAREALPLKSGEEYEVRFTYRILEDGGDGFEVLFYSPEAADHEDWISSTILTGEDEEEGRGVLRGRLKDYADYQVVWNTIGSGRILIRDITIKEMKTGRVIASDSGGETAAGVGEAFRVRGNYSLWETPDGSNRLILPEGSTIVTVPAKLPLPPGRVVLFEFPYTVLQRPPTESLGRLYLCRQGAEDRRVNGLALDNLCPESGVYCGGVMIPEDGGDFMLGFEVCAGSELSLGPVRIIEQDTVACGDGGTPGLALTDIPYPRFGNYQMGIPEWIAADGCGTAGGEEPWMSVEELESRLSLFDILAGFAQSAGTVDPAFGYRMRRKNPEIILLPYVIAHELDWRPSQQRESAFPTIADMYGADIIEEWWLKNSRGDIVADPDWTTIRKMNISRFCPRDRFGRDFIDYFVEKTVDLNVTPGTWDGLFIDNLFARTNPHIEHAFDPERFDADYNLDGRKDETIEQVNGITLDAAIRQLTGLRNRFGDTGVIIGNAGPNPEIVLSPLVNGYIFEGYNRPWYADLDPENFNEIAWARTWNLYGYMEEHCRKPVILILEAFGLHPEMVKAEGSYRQPGPEDIRIQRLAMGTALLGDGFYEYDLFDARSAPVFFDEWTVDRNGAASLSPEDKGWLGNALGPAEQVLREPEILLEEPKTRRLSGRGEADENSFECGANEGGTPAQYIIEFDWRIEEPLRFSPEIALETGERMEWTILDTVSAGVSGSYRLHLTVEPGDECTIRFEKPDVGAYTFGNLKVTRTVGLLFRRDFEYGSVFVNPTPEDFVVKGGTGRELRRIDGIIDPVTNTGEPLGSEFTVPAADALITVTGR